MRREENLNINLTMKKNHMKNNKNGREEGEGGLLVINVTCSFIISYKLFLYGTS